MGDDAPRFPIPRFPTPRFYVHSVGPHSAIWQLFGVQCTVFCTFHWGLARWCVPPVATMLV